MDEMNKNDEVKRNSVLIVDDENSNILTLTHILSPEYTVYAAKNGRKAIEAAGKYLPDVVLLDIIMPEMDGYEVLAVLKKSELTRHIPVIFITGLSDADDEEKGLALGASDYISKPFSAAIVKLRLQNQIRLINQMRLIIDRELAEKSSRARSEFLSRMSHEMRTPMNAIMGMARLAKNTPEAENRDKMIDNILGASDQLLSLIDNVLDMSDIGDNKFSLDVSEFSFASMIREVLNKAVAQINIRQQTLSGEIDPSIPDAIIGDEKRLAHVILNLLANASKFTPEYGAVQINAFAREVEHERLVIQIEVIDNGIGITKEQRENLFVPFEQGDGGIDRRFGGAGLGLAISKHIVELMDGEIWVQSEPGKGSKFSFTCTMKIKAPDNKTDAPLSFAGKTALLVDDVEINREIIMAMLEDTQLIIECAGNGIEALEMFSSATHKYDIIMMDINMPEMDGVEATRRIRALGTPEGERVPIIAVTANIRPEEVEKYFEAGMNDHIGKPVDFDKLLSSLNKFLNNI